MSLIQEIIIFIGILGSILSLGVFMVISFKGRKFFPWFLSTLFFLFLFVGGSLVPFGSKENFPLGLERTVEKAISKYKKILRIQPGNEEALKKLIFLRKEEIALELLSNAKTLINRDQNAEALVELSIARDLSQDKRIKNFIEELKVKLKNKK